MVKSKIKANPVSTIPKPFKPTHNLTQEQRDTLYNWLQRAHPEHHCPWVNKPEAYECKEHRSICHTMFPLIGLWDPVWHFAPCPCQRYKLARVKQTARRWLTRLV